METYFLPLEWFLKRWSLRDISPLRARTFVWVWESKFMLNLWLEDSKLLKPHDYKHSSNHCSGERLRSHCLAVCKSIVFWGQLLSVLFFSTISCVGSSHDLWYRVISPLSCLYTAATPGRCFSVKQMRHFLPFLHYLPEALFVTHSLEGFIILCKISKSYLPLLGQKAISEDLVQRKKKRQTGWLVLLWNVPDNSCHVTCIKLVPKRL